MSQLQLQFRGQNTHAELTWDPPIYVQWFRLEVTESGGGNTGFQEIEVYGALLTLYLYVYIDNIIIEQKRIL